MKNVKSDGLIPAIVFIAIVVHVFFAFKGIKIGWHPDEWRITLETLAMAQSKSLIPQSVNYPLFFRYLILLIYGSWFILGYLFRIFHSSLDFALLFFNNPNPFLFIPRIVNILLGGLTIYGTYLVGREYFDKKTGIVAAMFSSIEYQLFVQSQVGLHQTLAALSTLPIFYFLKRYLYIPTKKNLFVLALSVGIGASIHHTTILFVPLILYVFISNTKKLPILNNLSTYSTAILIGLVSSLLGNLQWIFKFKESLNFLKLGGDVSKIAFSSNQYFQYTIPSFVWWFLQELARQDYLLGILMFFSCFIFIFKREKKYLIILMFFLTYTIYFYSWAYRWLHILIGILPIMTIFAADMIVRISSVVNKGKYLYLIILLIIIPNTLSIFSFTLERQKIDTRNAAAEWITKNVSSSEKIGIDWSAYSPLIPSVPPIYLLNPQGKEFFQSQLPQLIKDNLTNNKNYTVIESIYHTEEPVWPTFMPVDEIDRAKKYKIYSDLYSYFNFKSTKELSQISGADYLVITSYSYTSFLKDDSPYKKNLFNIYGKDNMLEYQSHTEIKSDNERHRLLSYLINRAQEFYLSLLFNRDKYYTEIKRFSPDNILTGPDVIIFKKIR